MVKSYIIAIFSALFLLFGWFSAPVEISIQAPTEVVAGLPFDVEVTINKGNIEGFARFQQKLPKGFTAELIDAQTGTFSFEDQTVKFFWLIIPEKEQIVLKYRITTDQNISGNYSLDGIFSYIDGDKKYAEMPLHEITITPSPLADNVQDTSKIDMAAAPQITCKRTSVIVNSKGEIEISLLVNRGSLNVDQFAKIQEVVPKGYDAQSIETKGGIFTYQNNTVKFLWMTLPADQEYTVAYKLIPDANTDLAKLDIKGDFSYLVNGQTVEVIVDNTEKTPGEMVEEQLAYRQGDLVQEDSTQLADNSDSSNTKQSTDDLIAESVANENSDNTSVTDANNVANDSNANNSNNDLASNSTDNNTTPITKIETPNTDVSYRVQIAAGHNRIQPVPYFAKRKVKEPIYIEMLDGWYKYTVGRFNQYVQARNKRNKLWNNTPIKDAFVTAYNSGQRITVQEALMISNQTWVQ